MSDSVQPILIEIWSDIACPFCYIGKQNLQTAISESGLNNQVHLEWKSFMLNPGLKEVPGQSLNQYLSAHKNIPLETAIKLNRMVTDRAAASGIEMNTDKAIPANTLKAHRLLHYAKSLGFQHDMQQLLFKAYFSDGVHIGDENALAALGSTLGMEQEKVKQMVTSTQYDDAVQSDLREAELLNVQGVPFFVFNRKYAVSGAQEPEVFKNVLLHLLTAEPNPTS